METQNFMQVVEQTKEEKIKMYLKCSKQKLAEMLVECNLIIDRIPVTVVSPSEDKTAEDILKKHGGWTSPSIYEAMTEYGNLRWNKAIEEAVQIIDKIPFSDLKELISELNKLKKV